MKFGMGSLNITAGAESDKASPAWNDMELSRTTVTSGISLRALHFEKHEGIQTHIQARKDDASLKTRSKHLSTSPFRAVLNTGKGFSCE
jgi:hypothetical protein